MRHLRTLPIALSVLFLVGVPQVAATTYAGPLQRDFIRQEVVRLINGERKLRGKAPVKLDSFSLARNGTIQPPVAGAASFAGSTAIDFVVFLTAFRESTRTEFTPTTRPTQKPTLPIISRQSCRYCSWKRIMRTKIM